MRKRLIAFLLSGIVVLTAGCGDGVGVVGVAGRPEPAGRLGGGEGGVPGIVESSF